MTRAMNRAKWSAQVAMAGATMLLGCESRGTALTAERMRGGNVIVRNWDELFRGYEIPFAAPEGERPIQRIGRVTLNREAEVIVPDVRANRLLVLDTLGARRAVLSLPIPPSPVETPSAIAMGDQRLAHLFIPAKGMVVVHDIVANRVVRRINVDGPVTDLLPMADSGYVLYSPSHPDGVVRRVDRNGRLIRAALPIVDERVRIFHGRTQNGGIAALGDTAILVVEPSRFALHRLKSSLRGGVSYFGDSTSDAAFYAKAMPPELAPDDLKKQHSIWWDSFRHADRPFVLQDSLVLVSHYTSRGLWKSTYQVSIVTMQGELIAEGMSVPYGGRVIGVRGRTVIVGVPPRLLASGDSLSAYRLFQFTFQWPRSLSAM